MTITPNFDGNVQGFRLLLRLGLAPDEYSYNLTFPTLATVVKYPKDSITGNKGKKQSLSFKKYGYYQTDKEKFCEIKTFLGLSNSRHPLCFLLEAADDICYSVSDIEDGFKNKTISLHYLLHTLSENYASDTECNQLLTLINEKVVEYKGVDNKDLLIIQDCRVFVQIKMISSAIKIFKTNHDDIMNGHFDKELLENSTSQHLKIFFQEIAVKNFNHESVVKSEIIGDTVISYLLKRLTTARLSKDNNNPKTINGKICTLLSHQSKHAMDNTEYKNKKYLKLLQVVDFVASMTDSYALALYRELSGLT